MYVYLCMNLGILVGNVNPLTVSAICLNFIIIIIYHEVFHEHILPVAIAVLELFYCTRKQFEIFIG